MHPNVRPDLRYHHIFQCTTTSRLWVKVHPWCHRQKGAREWHDYCRRRVEYGFPECVFWHGWMVERMRSEVELVVVGVVEVDDEWQALLWGLHSSLITVTCPPYFFASRPPNQPKFFFFFCIVVQFVLQIPTLLMSLLLWSAQTNWGRLSLLLPSCGRGKKNSLAPRWTPNVLAEFWASSKRVVWFSSLIPCLNEIFNLLS